MESNGKAWFFVETAVGYEFVLQHPLDTRGLSNPLNTEVTLASGATALGSVLNYPI